MYLPLEPYGTGVHRENEAGVYAVLWDVAGAWRHDPMRKVAISDPSVPLADRYQE